jgi:hypothetical protein
VSTIDSSSLKKTNQSLSLQRLARVKESLSETSDLVEDRTTLGESKLVAGEDQAEERKAREKKKAKEQHAKRKKDALEKLGSKLAEVKASPGGEQALSRVPLTLTTMTEGGLLGSASPEDALMGAKSMTFGSAADAIDDVPELEIEVPATSMQANFSSPTFGADETEPQEMIIAGQAAYMEAEPVELEAMSAYQPDDSSTQQVTAEELESTVQEAVNEAAGDGHQAEVEMLNQAETILSEAQAETQQARREIAEKAPDFSRDLSIYMEQYARSDSQSDQSVIRGWLENLLDSAPDSMHEHVSKVRQQVEGMFSQSEAAWESREEAAELQLLRSSEVQQENEAQARAGQRQQDPDFLKEQAEKQLLRSQLDSTQNEKVQKAIRDRGVLS